jgi:hypothetical protein
MNMEQKQAKIDWQGTEANPYPTVACPFCGAGIVDTEDGVLEENCQHVVFVDGEDAELLVCNPELFPDEESEDDADEDILTDGWLEWATSTFSRDDFNTIEICMGQFPAYHQILIGLAAK